MFTNLRVRTDNTFLSSTITIPKLINFSLKNFNKTAAICDYNNMFGASEFYNLCLKNNIKPLIGVEFSVSFSNSALVSTIILFAKSATGYNNLVRLTSMVNKVNVNALEDKVLKLHSQDLICIIPSDNKYLNNLLDTNDYYAANEWLEHLKDIYKSDLYFGVYRYKNNDEDLINRQIELFERNKILSLALQSVFHKDKEDTIILNLLDCIKNQKNANREFLNDDSIVEAYFKNAQALKMTYEEEELKNLKIMINKCDVKIPHLPFNLPKLYENGQDPIEIIENKCKERLQSLHLLNDDYFSRLNYELTVIHKMGFGNYFLIVADYVNYAKNNDIMVGPARGSAASSLVAYLLNITSIDPLKHGLIFERFLNVARITMPDIDIDFLDIKRDKVIDYLKQKYGYRYVSHIGTFSTLGAKSAIRDMARVLSMSTEDVDFLLSFYPKNSEISLSQAYKEVPTFKEIVDRHKKYKNLVSLASKIEGLKRQSGIHAAGIIFYNEPIDQTIPTIQLDDNTLVSQYDYKEVEKIGLIKMDCLGLKNLTIIDSCLKQINEIENKNYTIDNFEYDYDEVYAYLSTGNTMGIFQLESEGMKKTIRDLKPTCFEDIVSLLALYRPGPMQNISTFIARKHKKEPINYLHEDLKDILSSTYGIIVYQEQIMQIVQKIASYSMSEADLFRRAIGKKDVNVLNTQKVDFIKRVIQNGYSKDFAIKLFDLIIKFADYGFNKAHSVAYSKIAVIMAAIKYKYPQIFYSTLLNMNADSDSKKVAFMNEAKYFDLKFAYPNVNESKLEFSYDNKSLIFGLSNIKTFKNKISQDILDERNKGKFIDIYDFIIRMVKINLSAAQLEALIYSGALDCFKISRELLCTNLLKLYEYGMMFYDLPYEIGDYKSYDYIPIPILIDNKDFDVDLLAKEKEMLGVYLSKHPIKIIKEKYNNNITDISNIVSVDKEIYLIGKINRIELRKNKNGKDALYLQIEDETGIKTIYAYDESARKYKSLFNKKDIVIVQVYVKTNDILYVNKINKIGGSM